MCYFSKSTSRQVLSVMLMLCAAVTVSAVNKDFDGPVGGDWDTAANWNPDGVPGTGDNVFVMAYSGAAKTIALSATPTPDTVNEVVLAREGNGTVTVNQSGGTLNINSWFNLGQGYGAVPNNGTGIWNMSGSSVLNVTHSVFSHTALGVGFTAAPNWNTGILAITDNARFIQSARDIFIGGEANASRGNGIVEVSGSGLLQLSGGWIYAGRGVGTGTVSVVENGVVSNALVFIAGDAGRGIVSLRDSGSLETLNLRMGRLAGSAGAVYNRGKMILSGGASVDYFPMGQADNSYGYYLHDTDVNVTLAEVGVGGSGGGDGVLEIRKGTLTVSPWLTMNRGNPTNGQSSAIIISGGTLRTSASWDNFRHGWGANGDQYCHIDVGAGGAINGLGANSALDLNRLAIANNVGILTVHDGGVVELHDVFSAQTAGTSVINFDGGTFRAKADFDIFSGGNDAIYIHAGGLTVDTAGFGNVWTDDVLQAPVGNGVQSISLSAKGANYIGRPVVRIEGGGGRGASALAEWNEATGEIDAITVTSPGSSYTNAPTVSLVGGGGSGAVVGAVTLGPAASGGFTKTGAGQFAMVNPNTYTGETVVEEGTLRVDKPGCLPANNTIRIAAAATINLNFSGTIDVAQLYIDGVEQEPGVYSRVNTPQIAGSGIMIVGNPSALLHRWSFNGDLADSISSNDAAIVEVGANNVTLTSSKITLTGGVKAESDYVRLGNGGMLPDTASPVTVELWATTHSLQNWSRIFSFGSGIGEHVFMSWTRGTVANQDRVEFGDAGGSSIIDDSNAPYLLNTEYHIAMTIEPGAGIGGTTRVTWYSAPAAAEDLGIAQGTFDTPNTLVDLNDTEDNLGRSFWNDATANASYNEVRIWIGAKTPAELEVLHDWGPNKYKVYTAGTVIMIH